MRAFKISGFSALMLVIGSAAAVGQDNPWIITTDVVLTQPTEVANVIVATGGSLTVLNLPEPGFQVEGNVWAIGNGHVRFENSVIQFLSTHHGQYALAGIDQARIEVIGCDYRVPNGVQHGLFIAGEGRLIVEDTDFDPVQLLSANTARLEARRLNGDFEILVQHESTMILEDIPRDPGLGVLWVWVEFPVGSVAEYSPPMPGFTDHWTFPPPDSSGIDQRVTLGRCETLLWPMLVREGSRLTLRDIDEDNWVVVGFYMPFSTQITGLRNNLSYHDTTLDFEDRTIRLVNASIDTWNLYPEEDASVVVRDSLLGEILSFGASHVRIENSIIDGSGGFLGARENSHISAFDSVFTCTIEATQNTTIELHDCSADPYPLDPTGAFTRFGAYENGLLLADMTPIRTTPSLDGQGAIAITFFSNPPSSPPADPVTLSGTAAIYSLADGPTLESWTLEAIPRNGGFPELISTGVANVEENDLGFWDNAAPHSDHLLRMVLTDTLGRTISGHLRVPGNGPQSRQGSTRTP